MVNTTIRRGTAADALGIAQVQVQSWDETYRGVLPDAYIDARTVEHRRALWVRVLNDASSFVWVADASGVIVGFINGGPGRQIDAAHAGDGEVYALYLLKALHNRGVGRALFDAARKTFAQSGYAYFVVTVLSENPSTVFYERMGGVHTSDGQLSIDERSVAERVYRFEVVWTSE